MNIKNKCIEAMADALNKAHAEYEMLVTSYPGFHETWEEFAAKNALDAALDVLADPKSWTLTMRRASLSEPMYSPGKRFRAVIRHVRSQKT